MTKGKLPLFRNTPPQKGTISSSYRMIICLRMMWKIQIAQITKEIYYSLELFLDILQKKSVIHKCTIFGRTKVTAREQEEQMRYYI